MTATSEELPMAPVGCALDDARLAEQIDRYRRLGTRAASITQRGLVLEVCFDADVDVELLQETLAVERQCCRFFTLDYDASDRHLSISVDGSERLDALSVLLFALHGRATLPPAR